MPPALEEERYDLISYINRTNGILKATESSYFETIDRTVIYEDGMLIKTNFSQQEGNSTIVFVDKEFNDIVLLIREISDLNNLHKSSCENYLIESSIDTEDKYLKFYVGDCIHGNTIIRKVGNLVIIY